MSDRIERHPIEQESDPPPEAVSPTALYTAGAYAWANVPGAGLVHSPEALWTRRVVDVVVAVARTFRRSAPSLRHSVVERHVLLDARLAASGVSHVVELAAGLSARASRFPHVRFVEVDLPHVIAFKERVLATTSEGRALLGRPSYRRVAGDATRIPLDDLMTDEATWVIAEGLCPYLSASARDALYGHVARALSAHGGGAFIFDRTPTGEEPPPSMLGRALSWLLRSATRGARFTADPRTREQEREALRRAGFSAVEVYDGDRAAREGTLRWPDVASRYVVFEAHVGARSGPRRDGTVT